MDLTELGCDGMRSAGLAWGPVVGMNVVMSPLTSINGVEFFYQLSYCQFPNKFIYLFNDAVNSLVYMVLHD
jgi:hypothetical protein